MCFTVRSGGRPSVFGGTLQGIKGQLVLPHLTTKQLNKLFNNNKKKIHHYLFTSTNLSLPIHKQHIFH